MIEQLLDTRVLLLFLQNDPALPDPLAKRIESSQNRSLVSLASLWELSQKQSLGLVKFEAAQRPDFPDLLLEEGFEVLPIDWGMMRRASALPRHHGDATDRLLVAEAIARDIPILSLDPTFDDYGIERVAG
ncbi:type II toxin-antitoxin system VapC family toxin [bacterium]|nr:type II toxin-antitoxin system VapC family toxin [Akkermansiaceae bacterium]MDB4288196.1 type II toxin-antitoxin system VapC family toxin [bacterium]MDA7876603.1 type II toxin-antitoxin system VapC family toxin [Akkermansiaceae bacterium]MDB4294444.1 type II toxin-antitoxin system VapC family toxin [Akkermansiaceae bacterium]MDB4386775.1 type II toxin-antitoxin system VapC family toxin [Akkermansiaceae bacterium]